ncbi:MAG: acyclic terpene utilization AtuA family protein [Acidimicrobiales bacterium]
MSEPIRIANCSGFYGDRLSAAREMVEGGPIDVLTGDWLAELTMLILARTQRKHPGSGYARTFVTQMEHVMGTCLDRGIKVVSNAGGLDPAACAEAVAQVARSLGLAPTIAYVNGDDLMARLEDLRNASQLLNFNSSDAIDDISSFITANAYLGCFGIVEALSMGADIVVTGRVTDAALVCGPAAWHHRWRRDSFDALAGAVVAGHVVECGAQVAGGNYSFFGDVAGMDYVGFPWVEVAEDGSSVVGKHEGMGGEVSIGTVTSQLLYEIGAPSYIGPDVTARFDTIALEQVDRDRVRISGVRGEAPPTTLKVAMNELGGYRKDLVVALTGLDIEEKARLVEAAFWRACPFRPDEYESVTTRLIRTDKADPSTNEEAVALWRLTLKDHDERKVGRAVADAVVELALATVPGFFIPGSPPSPGAPYGVYRPARVASNLVPQYVTVLGGKRTVIDSVAPSSEAHVVANGGTRAPAPNGPTTFVPLGQLCGARSGDKGGDANLGVFTRSDEAFAWLDSYLSVDELRRLLPETAPLSIDRFRLPALRALNFVIRDLLEEGVAASTRQDAQAKGLGEWLRSRYVEVPTSLLDP